MKITKPASTLVIKSPKLINTASLQAKVVVNLCRTTHRRQRRTNIVTIVNTIQHILQKTHTLGMVICIYMDNAHKRINVRPVSWNIIPCKQSKNTRDTSIMLLKIRRFGPHSALVRRGHNSVPETKLFCFWHTIMSSPDQRPRRNETSYFLYIYISLCVCAREYRYCVILVFQSPRELLF